MVPEPDIRDPQQDDTVVPLRIRKPNLAALCDGTTCTTVKLVKMDNGEYSLLLSPSGAVPAPAGRYSDAVDQLFFGGNDG